MGIRKKIQLGFVAIGFILLLSGVVAIFEMTRLTDLISGLLTSNIQTITSTNTIDRIVLKQNRNISDLLQDSVYLKLTDLDTDMAVLADQVSFISNNITIEEERVWVEELNEEFKTYKALLDGMSMAFDQQPEQRAGWCSSYVESYSSLMKVNAEITRLNQSALSENAAKLEGNYYRMIMPAAIAIIAGVFMIFFFNYFINTYVVNPIIQIKENIKTVLSSRMPYSVKVKTQDEISELNEEVKDLVSLLKKREKECCSTQSEKREA